MDEVLRLAALVAEGAYDPGPAHPARRRRPGASGWISIGVGGDGGPRDKAIPVIRLEPDSRTTTIAVTSADGTRYVPAGAS
ncbi:hypothetical protein AB0O64_04550 [Streptomyces sp. NPDC088341]|uniref:hypothetical protein n=1 Tax=Streptomyces sp. NPDC088341 TaxID=3154870 RepID=UPI003415AA24